MIYLLSMGYSRKASKNWQYRWCTSEDGQSLQDWADRCCMHRGDENCTAQLGHIWVLLESRVRETVEKGLENRQGWNSRRPLYSVAEVGIYSGDLWFSNYSAYKISPEEFIKIQTRGPHLQKIWFNRPRWQPQILIFKRSLGWSIWWWFMEKIFDNHWYRGWEITPEFSSARVVGLGCVLEWWEKEWKKMWKKWQGNHGGGYFTVGPQESWQD